MLFLVVPSLPPPQLSSTEPIPLQLELPLPPLPPPPSEGDDGHGMVVVDLWDAGDTILV